MNYLKHRGGILLRPVINEDTGERAGEHIEHWDDHVDARVRPHLTVFAKRPLLLPDGRLIVPEASDLLKQASRVKMATLKHMLRQEDGAWGNSGLFVTNWIDILDATQLAIDTSLTTHKWAMYNNSITPNYSTDVSYSATNEVSGTGYTAGGQTIVSPTTTESPAGTLMYDMNDQVWASPTSVTAYGAELYADALAGNNLIVAMSFGGAFTSTAGTFTIQFASTGVFTIDLTP